LYEVKKNLKVETFVSIGPIVQEEMIKILNFNNDDGCRNNGNRTPIDSNYLSLWRSELKIYN
jgi:hypothetical protein